MTRPHPFDRYPFTVAYASMVTVAAMLAAALQGMHR